MGAAPSGLMLSTVVSGFDGRYLQGHVCKNAHLYVYIWSL